MRLHQDAVDDIGAGSVAAARVFVDGDRLRRRERVLNVYHKGLQDAVITRKRLPLQIVWQRQLADRKL